MTTAPPDKPADFTASDILSADAWTGRAPKPVLGIDVVCTKIAVDFQNMHRDSVDECVARNLELLRRATACDCAFLAPLNPEDSTIGEVKLARSAFAQCRPEGLTGIALASLPWLKGRLEHRRLSELRDASVPRKEQATEAAKLAELHIGSTLLVALRVQGKPAGFLGLAHTMPRGAWDVNLQLLMKLIGTSLSTGLERIRTEARLAKLEERTNLFQAAANDGLWDFDVESNEVYFSPRWKQMLGYADEDMRGAPDWRSLVHPDDLARVQTAIRDHVAGKTPIFESTHRMRHRNGEWRWVISRATARVDKHGRLLRLVALIRRDGSELYVESTAAPIRDGPGHVAGGVLVFHDVSESRELNRRLSYHASHDLLTGLVNRREFESRLERALKSAKAREASYALCYLDIDQFKIVNDTCGHSAGDALLGQVGALLKSKVRWRDTLSRLGGDEFGILLESSSLDEAMRTAETLREGVRNFRFTWEDRVFRMAIQPLQRPEPGAHYELLLRLKDEGGRIVAPNDFIAAAERYGITPAIDRWVIENAFRWLVSDSDEREKLLRCSINLSGQSLGDDKFLPFVIDQFHKSGLDASKICFEITETAAVASFSQANRFIQALKELGCKFALDDFGTGLSSFGYLKHFPVDYLKIDGSFVREILRDPIDREMVRSINEIGHLTGKQTIAEFAENAEIIQMLTSLGVDYAQGYGVAQPQRVLKSAVA